MTTIKTDFVLDAKGLACPMPIVKTKKAMNGLEAGQVLEVQATDKGSKADIKAWSESIGHQYIGTIEDGDVLKHYIRKVSADEEKSFNSYPNVVSNEELQKKLNTDIIVLDVRETAEFVFGHIPNAKSIPLGELENRVSEIAGENEIYVVCRTGNRSDLAASKLAEKGFGKVFNVIPGMSGWNGPIISNLFF
jgi:rhodanese-related sulfurtransferase/TusA-related sulfurtransferase